MKVAIVRASDLGREGRWDAEFHIALNEVRERVEELKRSVTADEARARLDGIALTDKAALLVLARGGSGGKPPLSSAAIERIVKEYPHLSLAVMEQNLQPAIERMRMQLEADQKHLEALLALQTAGGSAQVQCKRCDSALDTEGFCTDETCPFSDVAQDNPKGWSGHPDHDPTPRI